MEIPTEIDLLVTATSWEDRCDLGFERLVKNRSVSKALVLEYEEYRKWSRGTTSELREICNDYDIAVEVCNLLYEAPSKSWSQLQGILNDDEYAGKNVVVDITTMPREGLWSVLLFLDRADAEIYYRYHTPKGYGDWQSREPMEPRFPYQMSGISEFGVGTVLIVLTGFDPDRTEHLIRNLRPRQALLGAQTGEQYDNLEKNIAPHNRMRNGTFSPDVPTDIFEIDAYSDDHGRDAVESVVDRYRDAANIIMASLGPKPTAVALYEIHRKHRDTALAYVPSGEFNRNYSYGIGEAYSGKIGE